MITVFSKEWFEKHNKILCYFANSFLGQIIFGFKKMGHYTENKIVAVRPNSVVELVGYKGSEVEVREHFFVRNEYALRLQKLFYPIWFMFHCWDMVIANRFAPQLNLGFDTLTVYPAAGANSPCDGNLYKQAINSWSSCLASTPTAYTTDTLFSTANGYYNNYYFIGRGILNFDTSTLTSAATISSAVLSLYVFDCEPSETGVSVAIYDFNPASTADISASDWSNFGSGVFSNSINLASLGTSAYNDFTLNASGINNISKAGVSSFGTKNSNDSAATAPTNQNRFRSRTSDYGSNKPKLVVTYTFAASFIPQIIMF